MIRRVLISGLAALVLASPAMAQRFKDPPATWTPAGHPARQDHGERGREARDVPLVEVIRALKMRYGGQHLDAQRAGDRYIISWITQEGRRLTIEVEAATGRTLSVRG